MGKHKVLIVAVILGLAVAMPVYAKTAATKATAPQPPKAGSTFAQRLAQRKAERQIKLATADSQRLSENCIQAQTNIRVLSDQTTSIVNNHMTVYNRIDAKLWVMIGQIKLAGKDTFSLERDRSDYVKRVATFKATSGYYKQTLDDLVLVKCQADTVGFKALLETARLYYAQIRSQTGDIRNFVVNTIKNDLTNYSNQLQPQLNPTRQ